MTDHEPLTFLAATRIEQALHRQHLTQRHLAALSGVSEGTIRRVLDGQNVQLATLEKIATALKLEVAQLIARAA